LFTLFLQSLCFTLADGFSQSNLEQYKTANPPTPGMARLRPRQAPLGKESGVHNDT
tara:strand:- start:357 stop:524 length:168 start_codon:yes stop_codon:yes gene_type:complete